jgi:hypothetical protein
MGTGSFPVVKRQRRGADHPSPSVAEVRKSYNLYPPLGLRCLLRSTFTSTFYFRLVVEKWKTVPDLIPTVATGVKSKVKSHNTMVGIHAGKVIEPTYKYRVDEMYAYVKPSSGPSSLLIP